ncbi:MAG: hypothetical protein GY716_08425 [bacterium]|nr:hypothetical protein [bacterium]
MAEEKETSGSDQPNEEKEPKKKGKMLFIVLGAVILAAAGAGGGFFLSRDDGAAAEGDGVANEAAAAPKPDESAALVALDTFLVNLNSSNNEDADRYMKLTLRLTISPEAQAEKISDDEIARARLRDRILTILSAKTFQDLSGPLGKESLRREIQFQADNMFEAAQVQDVLFSEFVVQ